MLRCVRVWTRRTATPRARAHAAGRVRALCRRERSAAPNAECWNGNVVPTPALNVSFWPADTTGGSLTVTSSQTMVNRLLGTPFAFGYIESQQGLDAGAWGAGVAVKRGRGGRFGLVAGRGGRPARQEEHERAAGASLAP